MPTQLYGQTSRIRKHRSNAFGQYWSTLIGSLINPNLSHSQELVQLHHPIIKKRCELDQIERFLDKIKKIHQERVEFLCNFLFIYLLIRLCSAAFEKVSGKAKATNYEISLQCSEINQQRPHTVDSIVSLPDFSLVLRKKKLGTVGW